MEFKKRWTRRGLACVLVAAFLVPAMTVPATAQTPIPHVIACTAAGTVQFLDGSVNDRWSVFGKGSCLGDLEGTYFLQFEGSGTSTGLGLCDGSLLVQDLDIKIRGFLLNLATGAVKTINHEWVAPVTTYPLVTPFLINKNPDGTLIGAGDWQNHIFLKCTGSPTAYFEFVFNPK